MAELKVKLDDAQIHDLIAQVAKGLTNWMPTKEHLPHPWEDVLISTKDGEIDIASYVPDDDGGTAFKNSVWRYAVCDVAAWMKLPDVYEEEKA